MDVRVNLSKPGRPACTMLYRGARRSGGHAVIVALVQPARSRPRRGYRHASRSRNAMRLDQNHLPHRLDDQAITAAVGAVSL